MRVELEADGFDVSTLFSAQKISCTAEFEIEGGDFESGTEVGEFFQGRESSARDRGEFDRVAAGGVRVGDASPLGDRFGAYGSLLAQLIAQKWKTQDVDARIHTAPPVIMNFTILRDGTIRDIRVKTSSGNAALDRSAERALYDVGKVGPLPAAYERDKAEIEFWFELKR